MQRVSSQLTIFLRVVLPTVWITFIFSIVILLGWSVSGKARLLANPFIWIGLLSILFTGFVIIRFLLLRLYRIDFDDQFLYVSNYFKTFKYPIEDIESIRDSRILPGRIFRIRLKSRGSFGQTIYFLASQVLWQDYLNEHKLTREKLISRP
ncbi:MAG TPA: hypothetical protein VJ508_20860 [Saprospiraceae bacterium]|nr:hypothetical protein [Saprospiraceae bacterium]